MQCPFCKEDILDGVIKCKHCGSMLDSSHPSIQNYLAGNIIGLLGSILMIVGLFLPWASLENLSISGWRTVNDTKILLVLGIAITLFSIMGLALKKIYPYMFILCSAASLGLFAHLYFAIQKNLFRNEMLGVTSQICEGFWLSLAGAVLTFFGVIAMVSKKEKK